MLVFTFYLTCVFSGIIELGAILWGLGHGFSVTWSLGLAVAYQIGNILLFFIDEKIRKRQTYILFCFVVITVAMQFPNNPTIEYILAFLTFAGLSTIIQTMRSAVKSKEPRWRKRCFRVVGFVLSAVMYGYGNEVLLIISIALFALSIVTPKFDDSCWIKKLVKGEYGDNRICVTMVIHQMHYFSYCYAMLVIATMFYNNSWIATLWFIGNWIPYIITEPLIKYSKKEKWMTFLIAGHVLVAGLLIAMYLAVKQGNVSLAMLLWVFTGFGGGNVFCIKKSLEPVKQYHNMVWVFSENIGHILGVVGVVLMSSLHSNLNFALPIGVVCAIATIFAIVVTFQNAKRKKAKIEG